MPNWVHNTLVVQGKTISVNKLKEQMAKPYIMPVRKHGDLQFIVEDVSVNSAFSFWNIVAPTDLEAYVSEPDFNDRGNDNSWYNWNIREWGVKWDASNSELYDEDEHEDNLDLVYQFETPWGVAEQALVKLSLQYPDVSFGLSFEEETGWGGEWEINNGDVQITDEYENKCRDCDANDMLEYCDICDIDVCSSCNTLDEANTEDVAKCDIHNKYLVEKE